MMPLFQPDSTRRRKWIAVPSAIMLLYGCTTSPDPIDQRYRPPDVAVTVIDARPAALIDGHGVSWGDIRDALSEAAGAEVLREAVLDQRLQRSCADRGLIIDEQMIAAEQQLLLKTLNPDPDRALLLLDALRQQQRLGPVRYQNLLQRNATLRALVSSQVSMNETALDDMYDVLHGPTRLARLITVPDLRSAERARLRASSGESFADVATNVSTDFSASRGGLLAPIAERDPSYPAAMRRALWRLESPGDISEPLLLDKGYALFQLLEKRPGDGTERDDAALRSAVRMNQERLLMDRLAMSLLRDTRITIFDDSLHEAWRQARASEVAKERSN